MCCRKLKRDSMGNNNEVVITDTDRLLLQKDEEVTVNIIPLNIILIHYFIYLLTGWKDFVLPFAVVNNLIIVPSISFRNIESDMGKQYNQQYININNIIKTILSLKKDQVKHNKKAIEIIDLNI